MAITAFLSRSPGLLNRGPGDSASLGHVPHSSIFSPTGLNSNCSIGAWGPPLLGAGFLYRILSPTDWTSCAPSYTIAHVHLLLVGVTNRTQLNPSTVKVISWHSSTGCTCYSHRYISYFDSLAGVNMLHNDALQKHESSDSFTWRREHLLRHYHWSLARRDISIIYVYNLPRLHLWKSVE